jgi:alcohol dehydrogenase class IV
MVSTDILVEDKNKNTLNVLISFRTRNDRMPEVVINEIRTAYSNPRVEFIELKTTSAGNLGGMRLFAAYENGNDLAARKNMLLASHYAGLAFRRAYVGNVHAAAHTLGGFYGVPHGLANAVLLPYVLEYYGKAVYKKLAKIADIMEIGGEATTAQEKARALIAYIRNLNAKMNIPDKITGIKDEDVPKMIAFALAEANPLYPVPVIFSKDDFKKIFKTIKA